MSQISKPGTGGAPSGDDLHVARYIVSAGGTAQGANYTTIASAYAAAVATGIPQTVFIQPGNYVENLTLSSNVNLSAFSCDPYNPNVSIQGKLTAGFNGTTSISGISFFNNADVCFDLNAGNPIINLKSCALNCTGNFYAAQCNVAGGINIYDSIGDISGTQAFFNFSAGGVKMYGGAFGTSIGSTISNMFVDSAIEIHYSDFNSVIETSGNATLSLMSIDCETNNATALILGGTGRHICLSSSFQTGNETSISIGAGVSLILTDAVIGSTNTNAISGVGTLKCTPISFIDSSSTLDVSIVTSLPFEPLAPVNEYFSSYLTTNTGNVTGDGTLYGPIIFNGTLINTSGSYDTSTGIYTAPSSGYYSFSKTIAFVGGDLNTESYIAVWAGSAFGSRSFQISPVAIVGNVTIFSATIEITMSTGDTMSVSVNVSGTSKNIALAGANPTGLNVVSMFSGTKLASI